MTQPPQPPSTDFDKLFRRGLSVAVAVLVALGYLSGNCNVLAGAAGAAAVGLFK